MANLITTDDFIGDINLPQRDQTDTGGKEALNMYINEYEPEFMRSALGVNFYEVFKTNLTTPAMQSLLKGENYTVDDRVYYWQGLIKTIGTGDEETRISPIAIYIYLKWMRNKATRTSNTGEVKPNTDNAAQLNAIQKMVMNENKMVSIIRSMHHYLDNNTTTYPDWDKEQIDPYLLEKNNEFGF